MELGDTLWGEINKGSLGLGPPNGLCEVRGEPRPKTRENVKGTSCSHSSIKLKLCITAV